MSSLKGRLALFVLPALCLVVAVNAALSYKSTRAAADLAYDRSLRMLLTFLREHVGVREGQVSVDLPPAAREFLWGGPMARGETQLFIAVVGSDGHGLAGENDLPIPDTSGDEAVRFADDRYRGKAVRVAAMNIRPPSVMAGDGRDWQLVVAESTETRVALAHRMFFSELGRQIVWMMTGAALAGIGLFITLRALNRLAKPLAQRDAEDLTHIAFDELPAEFHALAGAINRHMSRLADLLEASRRFAADVAHQLRTPLTLLGAQAQYSLRQQDADRMRQMIEGIVAATRGAQRLCNQMLSLSRVEAAKGLMRDGVRLDLASLLRETALDLGVLALEKRIDLAYADAGASVPVVGNEIMLHELFSNLIDNALRYTPNGGRVGIAADIDAGMARVVIDDSGPGIAPAAREAMFQRFHRRLDQRGAEGSGLGLAIVHQICVAHGGTVALGTGTDGGLAVEVRLPLATDATEDALKGY